MIYSVFDWLKRSSPNKSALQHKVSLVAVALVCVLFGSLAGGRGPKFAHADAFANSDTPNNVVSSLLQPAVVAPSYAVNHVIFNPVGLRLYTFGQWASYVHPQDSFMLVSGNNDGAINPAQVNSWAKTLRAYYPEVAIYAATSGLKNVREGAAELDSTLIAGLILIYEPNQSNAPEFSWLFSNTEAVWREAAAEARRHGLEAWGKPSGRAAAGRDHYGRWDYGRLAQIMDGQNIQTQGSCREVEGDGDYGSGFQEALGSIIAEHRGAGAASQLFVQVTISSDTANRNAVAPEQAFQCAQVAWSYSEIKRVTLWSAVGDAESVTRMADFLALREAALEASH